ncbi:MAG: hypothetical protein Q7J07_10425 [Pelolinea sp.]|nr:hypothetical protein [Pelolinea sp.]
MKAHIITLEIYDSQVNAAKENHRGTDIHLAAEVYKDGLWHLANADLPTYRNYRAFAILADVRNGYTFAGMDSGDPVIPISYPRGFPEDLSEELREHLRKEEEADKWPDNDEWLDDKEPEYISLGEHSFSWVTLQELLDYDLEAPVTLRGKVSPEAARRWKENREPPNTAAGFSSLPDWVSMEWQRPLRESAPLVTNLIEALSALGEPREVRLIFGFDN